MPRRFLTSEDVRRAQGGEILVDEGTVVTPQALETAQSVGVAIRTSSGAWVEPVPDRGPDAETASHHLPHLPEPSPELDGGTGVVVTAVGRNRPGVLSEITSALGSAGADVLDISQKTVQGYFHLVLTVEVGAAAGGFGALKGALETLGGPDDYVVRVMHERVFRFMHRI